jgi:hypothetical protein
LSDVPEVSREIQTNGWILAVGATIIDPEEVPRGLVTHRCQPSRPRLAKNSFESLSHRSALQQSTLRATGARLDRCPDVHEPGEILFGVIDFPVRIKSRAQQQARQLEIRPETI